MSQFRCSVIVATYNRANLLKRLFASLEQQDIPATDFEVIVIDDGSVDDTQAVLRDAKTSFKLTALKQSNSGPAGARNLGIMSAEADIIVTLDDDVMPNADLLRQHLEFQESHDNTAAIGVMALPRQKKLDGWLEWEAVTLEKQYSAMVRGDWQATPRQFYTANSSFKKADAIKAGLFDPTFRRAEDVELAYRMHDIGVGFQFLPNAVIYHEPDRSLTDWLKVPLQYGRYDYIMWRKGRAIILRRARHDFTIRKGILKVAARLLVGRGLAMQSFTYAACRLAALADRVGQRRVALGLYSAIFNLQYWQGFCESVGDRDAFWEQLAGSQEKLERREADNRPETSPPATT